MAVHHVRVGGCGFANCSCKKHFAISATVAAIAIASTAIALGCIFGLNLSSDVNTAIGCAAILPGIVSLWGTFYAVISYCGYKHCKKNVHNREFVEMQDYASSSIEK